MDAQTGIGDLGGEEGSGESIPGGGSLSQGSKEGKPRRSSRRTAARVRKGQTMPAFSVLLRILDFILRTERIHSRILNTPACQ